MTLVRKPRLTAAGSQAVVAAESPSSPPTAGVKAVGLLPALSESCLEKARILAATDEYSDTYDNVNILGKIAEQISRVGRQQRLQDYSTSNRAHLVQMPPPRHSMRRSCSR